MENHIVIHGRKRFPGAEIKTEIQERRDMKSIIKQVYYSLYRNNAGHY